MAKTDRPWTLITGVGPGTGSALARRFAQAGHHVALLARNRERLESLAGEIQAADGSASVHTIDVCDLEALRQTCRELIADRQSAPRAVVHDAVETEVLERNFRINTSALLVLAQELGPAMAERFEKSGETGAIVVTGNTSAWRGKANFAAFAPTKAAQRILAQSLARSLGPQGVHVAYVVIDAVIDLAWTRKRMPDKPDDFFIRPDDIADACFRLTEQPRSAWTFELDLRPFCETW
jgi:short-subunit dehydrogenase